MKPKFNIGDKVVMYPQYIGIDSIQFAKVVDYFVSPDDESVMMYKLEIPVNTRNYDNVIKEDDIVLATDEVVFDLFGKQSCLVSCRYEDE